MKKLIFAGVLTAIVAISAVSVSISDNAQPTKQQDIVKPTGDPGQMG